MAVQTGDETTKQEAGVTDPGDSFVFNAGEYDAGAWERYLRSLTADEARQAGLQLQRRSLDIDVSDEDRDKIVEAIVFQGHYEEPVVVMKGWSLMARSMDEDAYQRAVKMPQGGDESFEHHFRRQAVAILVESVTAVNGTELAEKKEDRLKYWKTRPYQLVDKASTAVRRFQAKIVQALSDADAVGNS